MIRDLKKKLGYLAATPFHPQWLAGDGRRNWIARLNRAGEQARVLDIGCFDKWPKKYLPPTCTYIGLDYLPTASGWYGTRPDVYADGGVLPVVNRTMDLVLLFDVCEHVKQTGRLFREICRVLKPSGRVFLQMPFCYPLHDEPMDFVRLTRYGLEQTAVDAGLAVESITAVGQPCETAALLNNIGLSKTVLNWFSDRRPACILSVFLPLVILKNNLAARMIARLGRSEEFMPHAYQAILKKAAEEKA